MAFIKLKLGDKHTEVQVLKIALHTHGYFFGDITEDFDLDTQKAVARFQRAKALDVTAEADEPTWKALSRPAVKITPPHL